MFTWPESRAFEKGFKFGWAAYSITASRSCKQDLKRKSSVDNIRTSSTFQYEAVSNQVIISLILKKRMIITYNVKIRDLVPRIQIKNTMKNSGKYVTG